MKKPRELTSKQGIVVDCNKYKEIDAMISFLSNGYKENLRIPGGYKPTSKNHLATHLFSELRVDVGGYEAHPVISSTVLVKDRSYIYENLMQTAALSICQECFIHLVTDEDKIDTSYFEALLDLKDPSEQTLLFGILVFLLNFFCDLGIYSKSFDCPICGKPIKKAYNYSLFHGGFLDSSCGQQLYLEMKPLEQMQVLLAAYRASPEQLVDRNPPKATTLELIKEFNKLLEESLGRHLRTIDNFENWFLSSDK